ncbi:hypothetical protein H6G76_23285 [Nostoc sp. FACHB-152]|uniref:hypothetical protein n=1 Tax=unclassified Nostoc TaxID=2593658 RepID=UPI001684BA91|nr:MULTISPECIES: hypothetical protein [unclassified Nostoc]MBD2450032.1 hypothetical protein [Nostoc sp. FACHB-152]MBD2470152.1 hypothetical protein [Nostoc sp. FACHB-145]
MRQTKIFWFILEILLWVVFGALIGGLGASIVNYTSVISVIGYRAVIVSVVGLVVSLIGLAIASLVRSKNIMRWVILGSITGSSMGFQTGILIGGYPQRSQADLSFITFASIGLIISAILRILMGVGICKYRQR